MEDPTNLMMITGVLIFGQPMDYERLKATLQRNLLRFDRFRQRVVPPLLPTGRYTWEDDPDFDMDYHLQRAVLPPPGDQTALQELVSLLASAQLDLSRPLWQFHLVEGYGDGCALICRLHHCIGDGMALVYVLLSMTETGPDAPWPLLEPSAPRPARRHPPLSTLTRPLRSAGRVAQTAWRECQATRNDPSRLTGAAKTGLRGAAAAGRLVLLWPDPKTAFKGPLGVAKRAAWTDIIPLSQVKFVGKTLGGTVNDVLLTALSGALGRYLHSRGERVEGLNVRAIVPVNLRQPGTEDELGNKFGLVFLALPLGIADPVERLHTLKERMDALKDSLEAPVAFGILSLIGSVPKTVQDVGVNLFGMKGTAVVTNVKGPPIPLYLAGAPLESLMFWVPQSGHLGMGVSILSYKGEVLMGVITDAGLVPDPEAIVTAFHREFEAMVKAARQVQAAPSVEKMAAPLDEELATLDAVAKERAAAAPPEEEPSRCQAVTKAGTPCKNRPLPGSRYCRQHQPRRA